MPKVIPFHTSPDDRMEKKERIRYIRTLMGLTRHEMERYHNMKRVSLEKWETGKSDISIRKATHLIQIAQQRGVTCYLEWLLLGEGERPTTNPHHQSHTIKPEAASDTISDNERLIRDMLHFKQMYPTADVLLVTDHSMHPQFSIGDYVGGLPVDLSTLNTKLDHTFIVQTTDGKKRLRRITRKHSVYTLYGSNLQHGGTPVFEVDVTIEKAYMVFWHRIKINL